MCVQSYFHPQDLLAMGLALSAMACAYRGRWIGAGILVALAILSQQFALLVAVPLFVFAPANRKIFYTGAAFATGAIVIVPLLIVTSGSALRAVTLGTGDSPSVGGTVLWELHLYGTEMVLLSRVAPLAISFVLSWWVLRRLGPASLEPATLMSIVAISLGLRLVFEQNLFSYYFMALTVSLVLLDVVRGHIRSSLVAWLAAVTLVFCIFGGPAFGFIGWGGYLNNIVAFLIVAPALLMILLRVLRGGGTHNLLPWMAVGACAILMWPSHIDPLSHRLVTWLWQVILVIPGLLLAAEPLLKERASVQPDLPQEVAESIPPAH
jgi:hypothetical protein